MSDAIHLPHERLVLFDFCVDIEPDILLVWVGFMASIL
jgi:hypothetical protein